VEMTKMEVRARSRHRTCSFPRVYYSQPTTPEYIFRLSSNPTDLVYLCTIMLSIPNIGY